jgi:DNA-binding response OmpR family regulator
MQLFLQQAHYWVDSAPTYASANSKLAQREYDFVLLAQELPDGDGMDLLSTKTQSSASFIVLTNSTAVEDRLRSFDLGADDCLPATVALPELERHLRAITRQRAGLKNSSISFGAGFVLDPATYILRHGTRTVPVSRTQFELLHCLLLHRGQALTRQRLAAHLRGLSNEPLKNTSNYIDVHIKNVRKVLSSFAPVGFLKSVYGIGYRMALG